MLGDQEPGAKPMCGCGQDFANERGLRHHLHDTHKLNKAIWLTPKLPRKRKRTCKAEAQVSSMEPEEQLPKKLRFYRYPPPRHELEYQLSENVFMPVPTLHSFVEEHPEQFFYSSLSNKSAESSGSSPVISCFSRSSSPCSSNPTTPGLEEFIDPRILEFSMIDQNQGPQPCDQAFMQSNSLHEHEIKNKQFRDATHSRSPGQSFAVQPNSAFEISDSRALDTSDLHTEENVRQTCEQVTSQLDLLNCSPSEVGIKPSLSDMRQSLYSPPSFVTSKANEKEALPKDSVTFTSDSNVCSSTEFERKNYPPTHQDKMMPRGEDQAISLRRPLTRAQARHQPTQHCPGDLDKDQPQKKLNAKEKRKLRDLKSQNMTLRQVGPHFPDIDTVFLRQAWTDIRLSDRCTRSRVK
ncbi:hypothetical protein N7527_009154 [Penicillium freii]|nr:hypothetical protein N7527_009154 [Penicillium freii]